MPDNKESISISDIKKNGKDAIFQFMKTKGFIINDVGYNIMLTLCETKRLASTPYISAYKQMLPKVAFSKKRKFTYLETGKKDKLIFFDMLIPTKEVSIILKDLEKLSKKTPEDEDLMYQWAFFNLFSKAVASFNACNTGEISYNSGESTKEQAVYTIKMSSVTEFKKGKKKLLQYTLNTLGFKSKDGATKIFFGKSAVDEETDQPSTQDELNDFAQALEDIKSFCDLSIGKSTFRNYAKHKKQYDKQLASLYQLMDRVQKDNKITDKEKQRVSKAQEKLNQVEAELKVVERQISNKIKEINNKAVINISELEKRKQVLLKALAQ